MEALRAGRTVGHFGGMLAAPTTAAEMLVRGVTQVTYRRGEDGSSRVRIENRGPVSLTARLHMHDLEPVRIGGVGSRFRATMCHLEDRFPENDSRPLPRKRRH